MEHRLFSRTTLLLMIAVVSVAPFWSENDLLTQIRSHHEGIRIWWMGHNAWLIQSGDTLISTDLVLQDPARSWQPGITPEELGGELDVSFVTHSHGDHFHRRTSEILLQKSQCLFVLPESCLEAARRIGIPDRRILVARPGEPFAIRGVDVLPVRAIHGNAKFAVYEKANLQDCGYRLTLGGKTFLQPGDSVLLEDQLFLENVDVLFFSPTVHNTHIDRSVILINELEPDYILPQHRDTFTQTPENSFWTHGYTREVEWLLPRHLQERYHVLAPQESLRIK